METLIPILAAHTGATRMRGRFSPITSPFDVEAMRVFSFDLTTMLSSMLATGQQEFTPELWWAEDKAWVLWTDYDLMGTRVFGSDDLIDALGGSPDIETLDWRRVRLRPPSPPRPPSRMEMRFQELLAEQEAAKAQKQEAGGQDSTEG
ncbi:hypothetical protein ACQCSV_02400 [Pseudarthrobacter sp. S3]|uniref:hypothetical protein n=1 Tax=Pseudarthrobacter sp. S3 TaxID=3418419 RepID=UPI003CF2B7F1